MLVGPRYVAAVLALQQQRPAKKERFPGLCLPVFFGNLTHKPGEFHGSEICYRIRFRR